MRQTHSPQARRRTVLPVWQAPPCPNQVNLTRRAQCARGDQVRPLIAGAWWTELPALFCNLRWRVRMPRGDELTATGQIFAAPQLARIVIVTGDDHCSRIRQTIASQRNLDSYHRAVAEA